MTVIFAQSDILLERVTDIGMPTDTIAPGPDGAIVVADGELTGHRHAFYDTVAMFRDDALARDIPSNLYIGHIAVTGDTADLVHPEHSTITLPRGTYRARRQRQLEPMDIQPVAD